MLQPNVGRPGTANQCMELARGRAQAGGKAVPTMHPDPGEVKKGGVSDE